MSITDEQILSMQGAFGSSRIPGFESPDDLVSRKRQRPTYAEQQSRDSEQYSIVEAKNPWDGPGRAEFFPSPSRRRTSQHSAAYSDNSSPFAAPRELPRMMVSEDSSPVRNEFNQGLPPVPTFNHERSSSGSDPRGRDWSDYALDSSRPSHLAHRPIHPSFSQQSNGYGNAEQNSYGYQHSRMPTHPNQSTFHNHPTHGHPGTMERTPFSVQQFQAHQENPFYNGGIQEPGKVKKRRGNLPKESTDYLMTWFMEHWERAYPDEPLKLKFCEHTGMVLSKLKAM